MQVARRHGAGLAERRRAVVGSVAGLGEVAQDAAQHGLLGPGGVGQGFVPRAQLFGQRFGGVRRA